MQPYLLTPSAEDDLKDIARYTLKHWGKKQSLHYASHLETRFLEITDRTCFSHFFSERYRKYRSLGASITISFTFILKDSYLVLSPFFMNVWIGSPGLKTVWIDRRQLSNKELPSRPDFNENFAWVLIFSTATLTNASSSRAPSLAC